MGWGREGERVGWGEMVMEREREWNGGERELARQLFSFLLNMRNSISPRTPRLSISLCTLQSERVILELLSQVQNETSPLGQSNDASFKIGYSGKIRKTFSRVWNFGGGEDVLWMFRPLLAHIQ